ncbi:2-oxo-4-hydroxy-4-carboxy-5-ureidoimidazoline decarboxylase [Streptomyces klenkii]|uniref:2-oxo-4-hydroxy-4-carboxy-5-ureidoimidazoline decarboxylase n=1 Tax=Streptomyces klenkii TaxID=1420899 RepID=UPI0034420CFB
MKFLHRSDGVRQASLRWRPGSTPRRQAGGPLTGDGGIALSYLGRHGPDRHGLDRLNSAAPGAAEAALLACCGSRRWARRLADLRPYPDLRTLLSTAEHAARDLSPADLAEALADETVPQHLFTSPHRTSAPAPPSPATEAARRALRRAHTAYEQRFGHVFVLCLDGCHPGEALDRSLAALRTRLAAAPADEAAVTAAELARLARGRLARLAPDTPPLSPRTVRSCGT